MVKEAMKKIETAVMLLVLLVTAAMAGFAFAARTEQSIVFTVSWLTFAGILLADMLLFKIYEEVKR